MSAPPATKAARKNMKRREKKRAAAAAAAEVAMEPASDATEATQLAAVQSLQREPYNRQWYDVEPPAVPRRMSVRERRREPCKQDLHFLLVLDFEAQCREGERMQPQEIVEFPTVAINLRNMIATEFHSYCRPEVYPRITEFCTELTGITQDMVEGAPTLKEVLLQHQHWLRHVLGLDPSCADGSGGGPTYAYVTCGDWDLRTCLPKQMRSLGTKAPAGYSRWINIKRAFEAWYQSKAHGMTGMLSSLGLALDGRHHSGIDDTRNITKVVSAMLHDGWKAEV